MSYPSRERFVVLIHRIDLFTRWGIRCNEWSSRLLKSVLCTADRFWTWGPWCGQSRAHPWFCTIGALTGFQSFTIGRGNNLVCAAIDMLAPLLVNRSLASLTSNMGDTWRYLASDSQMRWVGPEKGVVHLAQSAVINAVWDLWAKSQGRPVWRLVAEMSPEEYVRCIDFRYITDALTSEEGIELLRKQETGKSARLKEVEENRAVPIYTTSGIQNFEPRKSSVQLSPTYWHWSSFLAGLLRREDERSTRAVQNWWLPPLQTQGGRRPRSWSSQIEALQRCQRLGWHPHARLEPSTPINPIPYLSCPPQIPKPFPFLSSLLIVIDLVRPRSRAIPCPTRPIQTSIHRRTDLSRRHPRPCHYSCCPS